MTFHNKKYSPALLFNELQLEGSERDFLMFLSNFIRGGQSFFCF